MLINIILNIIISVWLVVIAVQDVRKGEVSNWLTIPPLLIAVAWRTIHGEWVVLLLFVLILFISEWPVAWPLGIAAIVGVWPWVLHQDVETTMIVWIIVLLLWLLNALGGADAKAVMTLTAMFPDSRLAWLILLCWWTLSLVAFVRRYGRSAPRILLATLATLSFVKKPEGHRVPALPALALAGLVFLWTYSPTLL